MTVTRGGREGQVVAMPEMVVETASNNELLPFLDQELSCLPAKFRVVIVLGDLESKTRKEVARQLGIPEGTVVGRLARARAMLAKRLARHGLTVSGVALGAALSQVAAFASAPATLVTSTIKAITLLTTGEMAATGMISAEVSDLTEGVVKAMFMTKIKSVLTVALVVGLALGGIWAGFGLLPNPMAVAREEPPKQHPAKEESPTWPVATKKDDKPDVTPADPLATRKEKWQKVLDTTDFKFNEKESGSMYSLKIGQMGGAPGGAPDYWVDALKERDNAYATPWAPVAPGVPVAPGAPGAPRTTFKFKRDGKDVLKIEANNEADFRIEGDVLYFAHLLRSEQGCRVTAHDLTTGKQLWSSQLKAVPSVVHSAYINDVSLKLLKDSDKSSDGVVWITGQESYGDYYEILDKKTGKMLGHKLYREGFGKSGPAGLPPVPSQPMPPKKNEP